MSKLAELRTVAQARQTAAIEFALTETYRAMEDAANQGKFSTIVILGHYQKSVVDAVVEVLKVEELTVKVVQTGEVYISWA